MARANKNQQNQESREMREQEIEQTSVQIENRGRANRIAITANERGNLVGTFYRTHKRIMTIESQETGWLPSDTDNKTQQRESYRGYLIENAKLFGIDWQPQDMRTQDNVRRATYSTDEELTEDAINMISSDINTMIAKSPYEILIDDITVDSIEPISVSAKGYDLSKLGVEEGKYLKNGNWAWANIDICYTLSVGESEIYLTLQVQLVSGQLKKPNRIGDGIYSQASFNTYMKAEIELAEKSEK